MPIEILALSRLYIYCVILVVASIIPTTPDPIPFLLIGLSGIGVFELVFLFIRLSKHRH